ncbi:HNH endonuclease [Weissella paramesenteroides]|uniref:HNH endonuclease n=1 Tax=Weissella paramesenteroides TaxID=1249 RepID=UPI001C1FCB76|nr:HNH endonuclease [Weissella paramesenteroides]MBU7556842.1 hypothetical protein [Weissella paramesenteroides]
MTKTQLLSQSETEAFLSAMNTKLFIMKDGHVHEVSSIAVTPQGLLKKPIKADLTDGTIYDNILTSSDLKTETRGYKHINLQLTDGSWASLGTHRLIHFADKFEWSSKADGTAIHHINTITDDNRAINLEMLTNSDNVLRFFDGRDNQEEIKNQEYLDERIAQEIVPMMHKGEVVKGYSIDAFGHVYHENKQGKLVEVSLSVANPKYPTNKNIKFNGTSASIHGLMAENFLITPKGKYKALLIDKTLDNPYIATNIYTVAKKHA